MTPRRLPQHALLALALLSAACDGPTAANILLCQLTDFRFVPTAVSVNEGETVTVQFRHTSTEACESSILHTTSSDDPATATVAAADRRHSEGSNPGEETNTVNVAITGVKPGGPVNVRVATTAAATPSQSHAIPVTVVATKGEVNLTITGLPTGVQGDVFVGSALLDGRRFTATGSGRFRPGTLPVVASSVTANGVTYDPTPTSGTILLGVGEIRAFSVAYSVRVAAAGTASVQVAGLPAGAAPSITITGNGVNQTLTGSGTVTLQPGTYSVAANTVSDATNDYADPTPSRQVTISSGQTTNVLFAYAIIATLVNLNISGLEAGLTPLVTLTRGSDVRTVSANTAALRLALGAWTIAMAERTVSIRTYQRRSTAATTLTVLAQTSPMAVALAYYCSRFQWTTSASFSVLSDPNGHAPFINLLLVAHLLTVQWLFPEPSSAAANVSLANQTVTQETVTISGQGSFVTVTGTRGAGGALNLTGTGTVAGFSNVPVALTGTLTSAGALTGVTYRMGQSAAPTGLPTGPITYSMSAPAPSAAGALLEGFLSRP